MPPVTGYETDDEWEQKTNADYGREWRNGLMLLGMAVGAIAAGIFVFQLSDGKNRAEVRIMAGIAVGIGMVFGASIGWGFGHMLDTTSTRVPAEAQEVAAETPPQASGQALGHQRPTGRSRSVPSSQPRHAVLACITVTPFQQRSQARR